MTPEMVELARRAVACKGWRWRPGMLADTGFRCVWADTQQIEWTAYGARNNRRLNSKTDVPDLTDPATLGCMLALVREVVGDLGIGAIRQNVGTMNGGEMWSLIGEGGELGTYHETEVEALVAALEGAP